jgi:hypothetical protein
MLAICERERLKEGLARIESDTEGEGGMLCVTVREGVLDDDTGDRVREGVREEDCVRNAVVVGDRVTEANFDEERSLDAVTEGVPIGVRLVEGLREGLGILLLVTEADAMGDNVFDLERVPVTEVDSVYDCESDEVKNKDGEGVSEILMEALCVEVGVGDADGVTVMVGWQKYI